MRTASKRSWLTEDRKRLVPDGHGDAAFLFANKGARLPKEHVDPLEGADDFFDSGKEKKESPPMVEKKVHAPAPKAQPSTRFKSKQKRG